MSYKSKVGFTALKSQKFDNLSINYDADYDMNNKKQRYAIFLYTPDMDHTDIHYHVAMDLKTCIKLRDWLNQHIEFKKGKK